MGDIYTIEGPDGTQYDVEAPDNIKQYQNTNTQEQPPSAYERVMEVPGAANRSLLQGTGYEKGATNFRNVPKYSDLYADASDKLVKKLGGNQDVMNLVSQVPAVAGSMVDSMVNPADLLIGLGATPAADAATDTSIALVKGADKNLTSVLRRIAGQSSSDIKLGRELMAEGGTKAVLSKTKAAPSYLGREIAPKAADIASSRVKEMNPNAMREIGIGSEDTKLAQDLKSKFGINEFPTKSSADEFYSSTINNAPNDIQIPTSNLEQALSNPSNKLDPRSMQTLQSFTKRTKLNPGGTLDKVALTKEEYNNLRGMLNNLDPSGETPAVQAIKSALDEDASQVIPQLAEAKGRFQLSRSVPKAEPYLDKTRLEEEMAGRLSKSANPESVQVRESLGRLLGPEGESLIKDTQAQRLAKQWFHGKSGSSANLRSNPILEFFKELARPIPRAYEGGRSNVINFFRGVKKPVLQGENPFYVSNEARYTPPTSRVSNPSYPKPSPASNYSGPEIMPESENIPYGLPGNSIKGFKLSNNPDIPEKPSSVPYGQPFKREITPEEVKTRLEDYKFQKNNTKDKSYKKYLQQQIDYLKPKLKDMKK